MTQKIGYIVGSLSAHSINRKLANALVRLAPEDVELVEIPIAELPVYNRDFDADYPPVARAYKDALAEVDGIIIVSPEHNRSISAALKNALEWGSRPYGANAFRQKPAATIGASGGPISTAAGQQHLRAVLLHLDAFVMGQPEGYIHLTPGLIEDDGTVNVDSTAEFLAGFVEKFSELVARTMQPVSS